MTLTEPAAGTDVDALLELGRELAAMTEARLAAYLRGCSAEELDVVEEAMARAEGAAGAETEAARIARERETMNARYSRWWSDPVAFARDAMAWPEGKHLHDYQVEALSTLARRQRLVLRKLRGAGGSAIAAVAVLWFAATREYFGTDWKIATTATVARQLDDYLWPEIHKWAHRLRWEELGRPPWLAHRELLDQGIKLGYGEAFAAAPGDAGTIEGLHASQVLVVLDEAKGIRTAVFDAIEGGSTRYGPETGASFYALAVSSAGRPEGRFYDLARGAVGPNWARQHITQAQAVAAGQVSASSLVDLAELWGVDSTLYRNHALGEFADDSADTVVPLSWVQAANERWLALSRADQAGVATDAGIDVARGGTDRSVLVALAGDVAGRPVELARGDGPTTAASALSHVGMGPAGPLVLVDSEGVGASVYDAFRRGYRDLGRRTHAFRAGTGTTWTDSSGVLHFANLRAGAWWHLRELLDPALGATLALPPDDKLTGDLTTPKWRESRTRERHIVIESKDEIRKRLGRSTDAGDALVMAAWGRVVRRGLALRPSIAKVVAPAGRRAGDDDGGWLAGDVWTEGT